LYFAIDLLSQRVLGLASEARGREQREIVNHERLARTVNGLVDEMDVLTEALKTERILRSHAAATARIAEKKSAPARPAPEEDNRKTVESPPPAGSSEPPDDEPTRMVSKADLPLQATPPGSTGLRLTAKAPAKASPPLPRRAIRPPAPL